MKKRINLFGAPGSGKSTLAARIFAALKAEGQHIELVTEFAKLRVYENRPLRGWDYIHTFGKQLRAEQRFIEGGSSIVTDSPIFLQCYYARLHGCKAARPLSEIARRWDLEYPPLNIYIPPREDYDPHGRWQNKQAAKNIGEGLCRLLHEEGCPYFTLGQANAPDFEMLLNTIRTS